MTTSRPAADGAYVWIWLPDATRPVVAGRLAPARDGRLSFLYGRSYLGLAGAIPIYAPELPLRPGSQGPRGFLAMPSCIRDAAPDAWGRRVIINRLVRQGSGAADTAEVGELAYLLRSGSDRIGALDFQLLPDSYVPRETEGATLDELMHAADLVQDGVPLSPDLEGALLHGTSIGGARPKALITDGHRKMIAKFAASSDAYGVVQGEYVAMRLAGLAGLDAAAVRIVQTMGKWVLLVERFDRIRVEDGWRRKALVSALTVLGLDEMEARYASYAALAEEVRLRFSQPKATLRELFRRIVFNVLVGNTDDHARNHAALWNGRELTLTPAYDICPQARSGREASQAMLITDEDRASRVSTCLAAARSAGLTRAQAVAVVEHQLETFRTSWRSACDEAGMADVDRRFLMGRAVLNPFAFDDLVPPYEGLRKLADEIRADR